VLVDVSGAPRFLFELESESLRNIEFVTPMQMAGIDSRNGDLVSFDLDFGAGCRENPKSFLPLLHSSVLKDGPLSPVFEFLTLEAIERYWNGSIFSEYFLVAFRNGYQHLLGANQLEFFNGTATTFCQLSWRESESVKIERYYDCALPPRNWIDIKAKYPGMMDEEGQIGESLCGILVKLVISFDLERVNRAVWRFACLELLALQMSMDQRSLIPDHFFAGIVPVMDRRVRESWEVMGLLKMERKDSKERMWWRNRNSWRREDRLPVMSDKGMVWDTCLSCVEPGLREFYFDAFL
jgi:hypothetical protein